MIVFNLDIAILDRQETGHPPGSIPDALAVLPLGQNRINQMAHARSVSGSFTTRHSHRVDGKDKVGDLNDHPNSYQEDRGNQGEFNDTLSFANL